MSKLPASTGWQWLKRGFMLFRKQPGILTMLLFANLMISLLISAVPLVGPLLAMVLSPSLSMAVMQACFLIEQDQRVGPNVLLTGFRPPAVRALCKLGLVYLGVSVVLTVIGKVSIDPEFWRQLATPVDPAAPPKIDASDMLGVLMIFLLQSVALMGLCFSAPLTYWQKMAAGKATFYSFFAVVGALAPMMVMLLAWFGLLTAVGMVATLLLGNANAGKVVMVWLVLLFVLLLQCAIYASYRQIFGDPAEHALSPVSLQKPG